MGKTAIWSKSEAMAWALPDPISVSGWASAYRMLDARTTAEPGAWKNARTPYLVEIMDSLIDPAIEEITLMASTQVGKTECVFNMMAYLVDQDPGPTLYVKAREDDAYSDAHNRLRPMFSDSAQLLRHVPSGKAEDLTMKEFRLDRMTIFFAGSNSPAALASKPIRYLFLDETDKYPPFSGREASPIKLAKERTRTFWNRKIVKISTPTTESGYIAQEYERSDKRRFFVPCPHCGEFQVLLFSGVQVPTDERDPGRIRELKVAYYQCEHCGGKIRDHQKAAMLQSGLWVAEGQSIQRGEVVGDRPHGNHAGFWINCLYSPWLTWSEIAAEFFESRQSSEDLMNFVNSWLAEIWKESGEHKDAAQIINSRSDYPPRVVPGGALVLTAGVDVQKHHFFYVIRAWGPNFRSWLIDEGALPGDTFDEIDQAIVSMSFPVENSAKTKNVSIVCLDSGYRTDEVYEFTRLRPTIRAVKGASRNTSGRPYWSTMIEEHPATGRKLKFGVRIWMVDTEFFKDFIFRRMSREGDEAQLYGWHVHRDISLDYADQVTSEQKITMRRGRTEWQEWQPRSAHAKNHLWDAEVYAAAAAHMISRQFGLQQAPSGVARPRPTDQDASKPVKKVWIPRKSGWLK